MTLSGKRKTIGVFIGGDNRDSEGRIIDVIMQLGQERDYNVLAFQSLMKHPAYSFDLLPDVVVDGESSVYWITNYEKLDGIVVAGESLIRPDVMDQIIAEAEKHQIPIVNVNDYHAHCCNVVFDDSTGMEALIRHLIREHGCRKINYISGFKGNQPSDDREFAYRKVLQEEGIPVEEERIGYGCFFKQSVDVVKAYLSEHPMPDAFVCANDMMALFVMRYLQEQGYRIPEDVLVTGFDHIHDAQVFRPSVTTVERSFDQAAEAAVELLEQAWQGESLPEVKQIASRIVTNQSCGCKVERQLDSFVLYQDKCDQVGTRDLFIHNISEIWRDFSSVDDMKELLLVVCKYLKFFQEKEIDFCICNDIFGMGSSKDSRVHGFTRMMELIRYREDQESVQQTMPFQNTLPDFNLQGEQRIQVIFYPLYQNLRRIGYVGFHAGRQCQMPSMLYTFLTGVASAINDLALRKEKEVLVLKLDSMSVRDALTRLYNRFGMQRYAESLIAKAQKNDQMIMGVAADLDKLKTINDTYGHTAGDNAIVQVANALRQASEHREICCRTGGDEFFVIGIVDSAVDAEEYVRNVEANLQYYNKMNQWPYSVSCSCGFSVRKAKELNTLEDLLNGADRLLYQIKQEKKVNRQE